MATAHSCPPGSSSCWLGRSCTVYDLTSNLTSTPFSLTKGEPEVSVFVSTLRPNHKEHSRSFSHNANMRICVSMETRELKALLAVQPFHSQSNWLPASPEVWCSRVTVL